MTATVHNLSLICYKRQRQHFVQFVCYLILSLSLLSWTAHADDSAREEGLAYLKEHATQEGVTVLPSGLQYRILRSGSGVYHPKESTSCSCHYEGKLLDGTVFDSSYERGSPTSFAPNQVIKGWTEAMQLMVEGDLWELTIPSELAYGERGSPPKIPGNSVLVFKMEILEITGDESGKILAIKCDPVTREQCNDKENEYIDNKAAGWTTEQQGKEWQRLTTMAQKGKMKPELAQWIQRRINILNKLKSSDGGDSKEL